MVHYTVESLWAEVGESHLPGNGNKVVNISAVAGGFTTL